MNQSSNNKFLAYVRVSSKDQSRGTSLEEQKGYIERYATQKGYIVQKFYGEVESASKVGRGIFDEMIKELRSKGYRGILFHKTDRSARNPKDQALLYDLMINGFELHFVSEGISTDTPQGRNMMYILWGLASGYSENLRAEINKGILGRLKQGRMPTYVPVGYKKAGECRSVLDPIRAPLMRQILKDYSTGSYSVETLIERANKIGLTKHNGKPIHRTRMHELLRNTFYYGTITHKRGVFAGEHEPLISKAVFDRIQYFLMKKGFRRKYTHVYVLSGMLKCFYCKRPMKCMTAKQKWRYYYCRNRECPIATIPEPKVNEEVYQQLRQIEFNDQEAEAFKKAVRVFRNITQEHKNEQIKGIELEINKIQARLDTMVEKLINLDIDEESYKKVRTALVDKQGELRQRRETLEKTDQKKFEQIEVLGKLLKSPSLAYEKANILNKRRLILSMVENFELKPNGLVITWKKPFDMIAKRPNSKTSGDAEN
ncbi:MAG: hypothetical protein UU67_C0042G0001 [Candidatus Daviesbacteria bacterium GW2011_GWB1_41_5]|uniref:Recombinase n=2 Tax=Patescibacteria group TaxID=1783273 RepID=A0A0G0WIR2_9BACT|nr:MAG: hypothetical protein UU67_C0042G0001 [Candidatus Daviesbacteria bacterium GW2011_GWB1_41_5]OHB05498.1 MAG: hypothetical protein A3A26_01610 [Candidatus Zambryskibacteria bacterium RIFCSPLOWO2_01_FULL_47_14]